MKDQGLKPWIQETTFSWRLLNRRQSIFQHHSGDFDPGEWQRHQYPLSSTVLISFLLWLCEEDAPQFGCLLLGDYIHPKMMYRLHPGKILIEAFERTWDNSVLLSSSLRNAPHLSGLGSLAIRVTFFRVVDQLPRIALIPALISGWIYLSQIISSLEHILDYAVPLDRTHIWCNRRSCSTVPNLGEYCVLASLLPPPHSQKNQMQHITHVSTGCFWRQHRRLDLGEWNISPSVEREGGNHWISWLKNSVSSNFLDEDDMDMKSSPKILAAWIFIFSELTATRLLLTRSSVKIRRLFFFKVKKTLKLGLLAAFSGNQWT